MSAFQPVNTDLPPNPHHQPMDVTTPTTPRPQSLPHSLPQPTRHHDEDSQPTPTKPTFPSGMAAQRQLPTDAPSTPSDHLSHPVRSVVSRASSRRSLESPASRDVDMEDSDGDDVSDGESLGGEGSKSSKKKKGQRFYCTDYHPCNLSFTRSEHLARHIRKHTGERPFQCHCSRRFSRLDNLRQHAQTVHVNEEIPNDSLAATGTRFQRQVRTDRVRPSTGPARSRASTVGSGGSLGRSHSRNLSTSSIGSTVSNFSHRDLDARRRPPPLMMAADSPSRARLSLDTFRSSPERPYTPQSPGGFSTPTSATFSAGPGSPRFSSAIHSPSVSMSRAGGFYPGGSRTPQRRLSVPSGVSPFQSPSANAFPPPQYMNPSSASTHSQNGSVFASPTSSTYSGSTYEPNAFAARENNYKRQTWHHPESASGIQRRMAMGMGGGGFQFANSSHSSALQFKAQPYRPSPQQQETRLPGIESFLSNARRPPSPMQVDPAPQTPSRHSDQLVRPDHHHAHGSGEWGHMSQHLTRLDIAATPPAELARPPSWTSPPSTTRRDPNQRPLTAPHPHPHLQSQQPPIIHQQAQVRPADATSPTTLEPETPRKKKRQGWYAGPVHAHQFQPIPHRTSPEDSSSSDGVPTPSAGSVAEVNPSIVNSNSGWIDEPAQPNYSHMNEPSSQKSVPGPDRGAPRPKNNDMLRLEALVAVATSEDKATS
ncbi:MAG: hypothetical protein M1814_004520 [Vezdaea aestivalis]|nr:MAG: hypothetical protein M1814_004520 [Vezdaea aestivalis]